MITDNDIVVDLNKVQWIKKYYINQHYEKVSHLPKDPTVHGARIDNSERALFHPKFPGETTVQRAVRLGILDVWTCAISVKLSAGRCLNYTGQKAINIYDAWCSKIFGRKKE